MFGLFRKTIQVRPLPDLEHPTMGHLAGSSGALEGAVGSALGAIAISINPDGGTLEAALALAEEAMNDIAALNDRGCNLVAANSLDAYNSDWRFGERIKDGGARERFENPPLSKDEFIASLKLSSVEVTGSTLITLWFECGEMFWGHNFSVTSFDGIRFSDVQVELQG